ncbi:hypothetical protein C2G38_2228248 [Gigaspora rosea]|uniref:MACPF domain-containing protein n=1 Tax=Gigaspora rosea TaxID=44941 RepID=A0A397TW17_9GLOM|nr:hypothetical protein C2G38_2228248 [Gigaspora rosea]
MKNKFIDVIINKSYDNQSDSKECYKWLPCKKILNLIRTMLRKNEYDSNNALHMGSNCFFLLFYSPNNNVEISQNDEHNYCISEIIEETNGKQIFCSASLGLSRVPCNQEHVHTASTNYSYMWIRKCELIISNITATDEFIRAIRNALNNHDKIGKLREIIKDYGYFYAQRLTLGEFIERTEKNIKNKSPETKDTKISVTGKIKIPNFGINVIEKIIGGASYSQDDKNPWINSLENEENWKIIGYNEIYPLFELLQY